MLEPTPGLSWRAHFRAAVDLGRVEPERRRSGIGPGRDAAGWSGTAPGMNEITRILSAIEQGDEQAAGQLLPLVYDELRKLAARRLAKEKPGQTLQATALRGLGVAESGDVAELDQLGDPWVGRRQGVARPLTGMGTTPASPAPLR